MKDIVLTEDQQQLLNAVKKGQFGEINQEGVTTTIQSVKKLSNLDGKRLSDALEGLEDVKFIGDPPTDHIWFPTKYFIDGKS